ncbi:DNA-binding transcriptional LysR family regulator [Nocardioides zeae]|uniref:DNA-binding transcriptional LysR family regulator n=2 Tax=Nocardioides zeae TaxID=1457234 RepID=A0ACC6IF54_9ACTN|nr:LysR family transcriptional regulator [Nocardioides zeae]MDQ1106021.1 DNA-binding transcriptional LysR family regulator [Nocardioides zeae]MDR6174332.1 DNA-binding transcriptional LysR family regulator [Nocardioides zeae]MDR6209137.1 DNA-binding transcriptional LysR family regulator [Nocardioides zeae]
METRRLEMYVSLVDAQSFRTAAEQLFISQPALSQQIIRLESDLGIQLLDRSTRPFTVTAAGREFYLRCRSVLEQVHGLEGLLNELQAGELGRVRVALTRALVYGHLPAVIKEFRDASPRVDLPITYSTTVQILEELEGGRQDVAVLYTRHTDKGFSCVELYAEPYLLALPADHPLAERTEVAVADLRHEQIITIPRHAAPEVHDALVVACMKAGFSPRGPVAAGSYLDHIGMVAAGAGVSFLPRSLAATRLPNVVYRPIVEPRLTATAYLVWHPERATPEVQRFLDVVVAAYQRDADAERPWMPAYQDALAAEGRHSHRDGDDPWLAVPDAPASSTVPFRSREENSA